MNGTALFGFPLDVDKFTPTHAGCGADARGCSKGVIAQLQIGETIDLGQLYTTGFDTQGAVQNGLLQLLLILVAPEDLRLDGGVHIDPVNTAAPRCSAR